MNLSSFLKLGKPLETEKYDINTVNHNADLIDNAFKEHEDRLGWLDRKIDTTKTEISNNISSHAGDGSIHFTVSERNKLAQIESGAQVNTLLGVKGDAETAYRTGYVNITPANIGADAAGSADKALVDARKYADDNKIAKSEIDSADGVAPLDSGRKIPSANIPFGDTADSVMDGGTGKQVSDKIDQHLINYNNPHKVDKYQVGLGNADNTSDIDKPVSNAQQLAINEEKDRAVAAEAHLASQKADLTSPAFTGTPNAPTASPGTNTTQLATTAFVQTAVNNGISTSEAYADTKIAALINGAPATLDTLGEIADAMQENEGVVEALDEAIGTKANQSDLNAHLNDTENPHGVTKAQVGLENVPNVATDDQTPTFTQAAVRTNIISGEKLSVIMGKVRKWFSDLKTVAFTGSYNDLDGKPAIPPAVEIKGNAETEYRTGQVNLTPENIGVEPQIIGYYGSDAADTDGWYKIGTVSQAVNTDVILNLLLTQTYAKMATGVLHLHTRCNSDSTMSIKTLKWMYRMGFAAEDVKIATANNTWSLYVRQTVSRWGRIQVKVLSKAGTFGDFNFSLSNNMLKEASEPDGTYAADGAIVYHAKTALKAEQDAEGNALADTYQTKTGDTGDNTVSFTSGDAAEPAGWADIDTIFSGENHSSLFRKLSLAVKNVRYMRKLLGSTDISSFVGNGTVTGMLGAIQNGILYDPIYTLNEYTQFVRVYVWSDSQATTEKGFPCQMAGMLFVEPEFYEKENKYVYIRQTYIARDNTQTYTRIYDHNTGVWSDWKQIAQYQTSDAYKECSLNNAVCATNGSVQYAVKNGMCIVRMAITLLADVNVSDTLITSNLPEAFNEYFDVIEMCSAHTGNVCIMHINKGNMYINSGKAGDIIYHMFSYPVK